MARPNQNEKKYTLDCWKGAGGATNVIGLKINGQKAGRGFCILYDPDSDSTDQKAITQFSQENKFPLDVDKFKNHWETLAKEEYLYRTSIQFQHVLLKYIIGGGVQKFKLFPEDEETSGLNNDLAIKIFEENLIPPVVTAREWFLREQWSKIRKQNPNVELGRVLEIINEQWDALEDKSKYIELEEKDKLCFKADFKD